MFLATLYDHASTSSVLAEAASHAVVAAATLWEVLGTEAFIFIFTLLFSLVLRSQQQRMARGKGTAGVKHMGKQYSSNSSPNTSQVRASVQQGEKRLEPRVTAAEKTPSVQLSGSAEARCAAGLLIDKIVEMGTRREMSKEAAEEVLNLYSELIALLDRSGSTVSDVSWWARCTALELYSLVILSAFRSNRFSFIESSLKDMKKQRVERSLAFYERLMKHFAGQRHFKLALCLYPKLLEDGFQPSITTRSCLIRFAVEVGEYQLADGFFGELCVVSSPSIRVCMTMLRAYAKLKDWPAARDIIYVMQRQGVRLDSLVLNVALSIAVSVEKVEEGHELFKNIASLGGLTPDIVTFNTLIKGYVIKKDQATVQELLGVMRKAGIEPNVVTRNTMAN